MKTKHPSPECDTCKKNPCECRALQQQELLQKLTQLNKEVQDLLEEIKEVDNNNI